MQHTVKLAVSAGVTMAAVALAVSSAFAANSIFNTGNNVHFTSNKTTVTTATVNNTNTNISSQSSSNTINTGGNKQKQDIGGGDITSGDANVMTMQSVMANANVTLIHF